MQGSPPYGLVWPGKDDARRLARLPPSTRLVACPDDSVRWRTTRNLVIEGDNLEALRVLRRRYAARVRVIYIDPPYNTGKDYLYPDDFRAPGGRRDPAGRHAVWLSMMLPRLMLARELLAQHGVLFISIDDTEIGNLRVLCDEVFGETGFICQFVWVKKRKGSHLSNTHRSMTEHVLAYARERSGLVLFGEPAYAEKQQPLAKKTNSRRILRFPAGAVATTLEDGTYPATQRGGLRFSQPFSVIEGHIPDRLEVEGPFVWTQRKLDQEIALGTTIHLSTRFGLNVRRHDQARKIKAPSTLLIDQGTNETAFADLAALFGAERVFDFTKPVSLLRFLIDSVTHATRSGIVLDFFAGSGTTGHAVMDLNAEDRGRRRFVLIQSPQPLDPSRPGQRTAAAYCDRLGRPRTIAELTKERLRRAGRGLGAEIDRGFRVFKLEPRI
jgi:adenine-specific DNA-methyltransferase